LEVKLEVSSLGEKVTLQAGGQSTDAFTTRSRNAETFLRLKDGEKAVLAGLISDTERTSTSKLLFLADIPVLGVLFKAKDDRKEETDILMSITPRIIKAMDILPDDFKPIPSGREETYTGGPTPPPMPMPDMSQTAPFPNPSVPIPPPAP
jgi:general secretion pathway protein D